MYLTSSGTVTGDISEAGKFIIRKDDYGDGDGDEDEGWGYLARYSNTTASSRSSDLHNRDGDTEEDKNLLFWGDTFHSAHSWGYTDLLTLYSFEELKGIDLNGSWVLDEQSRALSLKNPGIMGNSTCPLLSYSIFF